MECRSCTLTLPIGATFLSAQCQMQASSYILFPTTHPVIFMRSILRSAAFITASLVFAIVVPSPCAETEILKGEAIPKARPAAEANVPEAVLHGREILAKVRMSQALQQLSRLKGGLRNDETGKEVPFDLTMADGLIRFVFKDPNEILNLNIESAKLTRLAAGSNAEVPRSLGSEQVRQTHINYEDLSMRFLYWPNATLTGTDSVRTRKCWVVRSIIPQGDFGPYGTVDVWVDQASGAMMMMRAYDFQGKKVKEFKVISGQKYKEAWILREMRVESYDAIKGDLKGRTYMEIKDPG